MEKTVLEQTETVSEAVEACNSASWEQDANKDPEDPLNWPLPVKTAIVVQAGLFGACATLTTAIVNPALVGMAKEFDISTVKAAYSTTVGIAVAGVSPCIWIPVSNTYGRRPVYLGTTLISSATALAGGKVKSFNQLLAVKIIQGIFPAAIALGVATVIDLFAPEQRGRAMGIYLVLLATGAHIAPLLGGVIGQFAGWRWTQYLGAIVQLAVVIIALPFMPETLFVRRPQAQGPRRKFNLAFYISRLKLWSPHPELRMKAKDFFVPVLKVTRYPSVLLPAIYFGTCYALGSILPALTMAQVFHSRYNFDSLQTGLGAGTALSVGSIIGEFAAGWVVDMNFKRERLRHDGEAPPPEARLKAIWPGVFICPAGLLIYGFTIQYHTHWLVPLFGMGISCLGMQIVATACYTYAVECCLPAGLEISQVFSFMRQELGMTLGFYAIKLAERIGYQFAFVFFAGTTLLAFLPVLVLMRWGARIRARMGPPLTGLGGFGACGGEAKEG